MMGCVKFDADLVVNKDSTVSGTVIYAMSDALSELSGSKVEPSPSDFQIDTNTKNITIEIYDQQGFEGQRITLGQLPFSEFKSGGQEGDLTITPRGDLIRMKGFLDLNMDTTNSDDPGEIFGKAFAQYLLSTAKFKIRVMAPAEVVITIGKISKDRRTITWELEIYEGIDLTTTVKLPSVGLNLHGGIGIFLILLVSTLIISSKRTQSVKEVITSARESLT